MEKLLSGFLKIADPPIYVVRNGDVHGTLESWLSYGLCWCWACIATMSDVCQRYLHFNNPPLFIPGASSGYP